MVVYHKLQPGATIQQAITLENELKKVHQARVDKGQILNWSLWAKQLSSNPNVGEYDYMTVIQMSDFNQSSYGYQDDLAFTAVGGKDKLTSIFTRIGSTSKAVKAQFLINQDGLFAENYTMTPGMTMVANYMKVKSGKELEYVAVEKEFRKVHQERINLKTLGGWQMWDLFLPAGAENGYTYITIDLYNKGDQLVNQRWEEAIGKGLAGQDILKVVGRLNQTRELYRQELFTLGASTTLPPSAQASR